MTHPLVAVDARSPGAVLEALRDALSGGDAVNPRVDGDVPSDLPSRVEKRIALVIETSGSTGRSKRVALSAGALLAGAAAADQALAGPGQWVLALPAHYVAGTNVLVRSLATETAPELLPVGHFSAAAFFAAADRLDAPVRYTSLVPAQLTTVLDAARPGTEEDRILRRFDAILVGGQATPASLLARAQESGARVVRTYGSSETSGGCVYDGVPVGRTRATVVDGQLELTGPTLAEYYLGDPERTEAAFVVRDGTRWYRTGDAGEVDVDGRVTVTGRLDDVIVSGGEKVSLGVVERVVQGFPGLAGAVVVRAPHARWGEVPVVALARDTAEEPPGLDALRASVVEVAGRAAAPDRLLVVDALPLLPSGKPDRVALTRLAAEASSPAP
ncbi:putative 2-succinylbenzoate--CoA ligase [Frondihabitans sp. 762G35]|uniref:AMP-binding protein n=1 Tax=Frondihabitans sp. 762G35 TaxID=1446794 RepID=UPI000D20EEC3|nr:AMP-binding protein [Frondihabitans sp. 762G35]ARC57618.1 putative 2-succinylbenzoate--CoA ligase [Frondihabitans sp. 762G35]